MPSTQQPNCQRSKPKPSRQADWAKVPATGQEASPMLRSDLLHTQVKNLAQVEGVESRARRAGCQLGGKLFCKLAFCQSAPRLFLICLSPAPHAIHHTPTRKFLTNFVPIYGRRTSPQGAPEFDFPITPNPLHSNDLRPAIRCQSANYRVETKGIEPSTPALQRQCSPN
jgi:hypothetical protein